MPHTPSVPKLQPQNKTIAPKPHSAALETEREKVRQDAKKRTGYTSTVLTAGQSLGELNVKRQKAERLGVTGA